MPGKHEPTSKRSLYLSVATSTLRGIILVGLVVLGILGLTKLFPENASLGVTPGSPGTVAPSTAGSSPSPTPTPTKSRKARPKGQVSVLVLNGTSKTGEASLVTERLKTDGYDVKTPDNYPTKVQTTIIYYQADSFPEAQRLQRQRFTGAELKPAPATQDVDLEVIVGADQL